MLCHLTQVSKSLVQTSSETYFDLFASVWNQRTDIKEKGGLSGPLRFLCKWMCLNKKALYRSWNLTIRDEVEHPERTWDCSPERPAKADSQRGSTRHLSCARVHSPTLTNVTLTGRLTKREARSSHASHTEHSQEDSPNEEHVRLTHWTLLEHTEALQHSLSWTENTV